VAYYLGIDGGGSKTHCVVGDEVSALASSEAGPSNVIRVGEDCARESLHRAIREACAAARINPEQIRRACIGVAGAGRDEVARVIRKIVAEAIPSEVEVVGDMEIALAAAFGSGPGVIVIAGTGSIAYGRDAQGRSARAGGWGFAVSDEGSAHWIGRAAVSALLRTIDETIDDTMDADASALESPLFLEVAKVWKVATLDEFVRKANSSPDFAALFPAILAADKINNSLATEVLSQAGKELARLAAIVARRLFVESESDEKKVAIAVAGGVFRHSFRVRDVFRAQVREFNVFSEVEESIADPAVGALQMARMPAQRSR